ncbi:hypothetical protein C2G38_1956345 [Gigaspora rosea]|uniref:Uncharacterized protein n=1 Tax=Gigaspora rosea TaxID=44941 RepID=A0A397W2A9_9GLOM|nr:hypothetical protein C2G38_1956345 [Gigaspora rosea]
MSHKANLNILSFEADGARSEFNAQSIITNEASNFLEYEDSFYKIHFKAPIYNGKLFIRIQDPKHAKKTARNQIFSGAKLLSLRINTICYDQLFKLAHQSQHFLLKRDVLNVDKQDDGAALRTFHSNNLKQILINDTLPDESVGLFEYLFVLGELFDAYLCRNIDHKIRIEMALRAYFFLNMWKKYIECCIIKYSTKWYNLQKSFISSQSFDIFISMVESLVMLVIAHREYYSQFPLLPWEHGTEALEHIFGISRRILPDFNFYEFFKIQQRVSFRDKISRAGLIDTSRDRNSAAGYIFDIDNASLSHEIIEKLCTWPTNEDIQECTRVAFNESILLVKYVHIYSYDNDESFIPEFTKSVEQIDDITNCEDNELIGKYNLFVI